MDSKPFEPQIGPSTSSGPFLRFHKQSVISPWPKALSKKRAYMRVGPFGFEMAGRTSRYTNPEAIIEIPFDPVLYLKIITERRAYISFDNYFEKAKLYQNLLESGKVKNLGELARMKKVSKARIFKILDHYDNKVKSELNKDKNSNRADF